MKSSHVLCLAVLILSATWSATATSAPDDDKVVFTKLVDVFGIKIYATPTAPNDKLLHAANVVAQYLDNDEDGIPDDQRVVDALNDKNAVLIMTKNSGKEWQSIHADLHYIFPDGVYHDCFADEAHPNAIANEGFDGLWEEALHLITRHGWGNAYPKTFKPVPGTEVAHAVDLARDGHFEETPKHYSENAWYQYTDESCAYGCQIDEYMYWCITSMIGAQSLGDRADSINEEWGLNTKEKLKAGDPTIYALLTDPRYNFPTRIPDGNYRDTTFPIQKINFELKVQDKNAFPPKGRYPATILFVTVTQAPGGEATKVAFSILDDHEYAGRKLSLTTATGFTLESEINEIIETIRPELKDDASRKRVDWSSIEGRRVWLTTEPMVGVTGEIFPKIVKIEPYDQ